MGASTGTRALTLFLCGDVMTGRGIDQLLPHPGDPRLIEEGVQDARGYLELAERHSGPLPKQVSPAYVWGDALDVLAQVRPECRIINLETSITTSDAFWPGKEVHYRMHPGNVDCITAARVDACVLANNHVLDFGRPGLVETLEALHARGIATAGAGRTLHEARRPARVALRGGGAAWLFALGSTTSGIPTEWAAARGRSGVALLEAEPTEKVVARVAVQVRRLRRMGDCVIASVHWGSNWGYQVLPGHQALAHALIDAGVDVVHGHSSHHVRPIELYRGKLILYGCGDFIDDYEGIHSAGDTRVSFRDELRLMFFPTLDAASGALHRLEMVPLRTHHLRLERASPADCAWLADTLTEVSRSFGTSVEVRGGGTLEVRSLRPQPGHPADLPSHGPPA